jgi:hypothetical protein
MNRIEELKNHLYEWFLINAFNPKENVVNSITEYLSDKINFPFEVIDNSMLKGSIASIKFSDEEGNPLTYECSFENK